MDNRDIEVYWLRKEVIQLRIQLAENEQKEAETLDLLMKGETMRSRMMFNAILDGVIPRCTTRES